MLMVCPYCGKKTVEKNSDNCQKGEEGFYNNRYFHKECYQLAKTVQKDQWPSYLKKMDTEEGELTTWTDMLWDFFAKDLMYPADYKKIRSQLKNFYGKRSKEEGGKTMKYKGMFLTAKYCYEVKKMNLNKAEGGIGIIPYYYMEAERYFLANRVKSNAILDMIEKQLEERRNLEVIKVKNQKKTSKIKTYNLDDIINGDLDD